MSTEMIRVGGEILVNTATASLQESPQITALSNGGFVVTWYDGSQGVGGATGDTSSTAIKAQIFTAAGAAVGGEILVNTATAGHQVYPQITALGKAASSSPGSTAAKASAGRLGTRVAWRSRRKSSPRTARR